MLVEMGLRLRDFVRRQPNLFQLMPEASPHGVRQIAVIVITCKSRSSDQRSISAQKVDHNLL